MVNRYPVHLNFNNLSTTKIWNFFFLSRIGEHRRHEFINICNTVYRLQRDMAEVVVGRPTSHMVSQPFPLDQLPKKEKCHPQIEVLPGLLKGQCHENKYGVISSEVLL